MQQNNDIADKTKTCLSKILNCPTFDWKSSKLNIYDAFKGMVVLNLFLALTSYLYMRKPCMYDAGQVKKKHQLNLKLGTSSA